MSVMTFIYSNCKYISTLGQYHIIFLSDKSVFFSIVPGKKTLKWGKY